MTRRTMRAIGIAAVAAAGLAGCGPQQADLAAGNTEPPLATSAAPQPAELSTQAAVEAAPQAPVTGGATYVPPTATATLMTAVPSSAPVAGGGPRVAEAPVAPAGAGDKAAASPTAGASTQAAPTSAAPATSAAPTTTAAPAGVTVVSFTCTNSTTPDTKEPATELAARFTGIGTVATAINGKPDVGGPARLDGTDAEVMVTQYQPGTGGTCTITVDGKVTTLVAK